MRTNGGCRRAAAGAVARHVRARWLKPTAKDRTASMKGRDAWTESLGDVPLEMFPSTRFAAQGTALLRERRGAGGSSAGRFALV